MAFLPLAFSPFYIFMEVEPVQKGDHTGTVDMDFLFWFLSAFAFLNNNWLSYSFVKWVEYFVAFMMNVRALWGTQNLYYCRLFATRAVP